MTPRGHSSAPTVVGIVALVVAMALLYYGVMVWRGLEP